MGMIMMPNGSGGMMFIPTPDPAPTAPERYHGSYTTADNVRIDITYQTNNKTLADQYEATMMEHTGWQMAPPIEVAVMPQTLWGKIGAVWAWTLLVAVVLPFVVFLGAIGLNIADLIQFHTIDNMVSLALKADIFVLPTIALILTGVLIFSDSSQKSHKVS